MSISNWFPVQDQQISIVCKSTFLKFTQLSPSLCTPSPLLIIWKAVFLLQPKASSFAPDPTLVFAEFSFSLQYLEWAPPLGHCLQHSALCFLYQVPLSPFTSLQDWLLTGGLCLLKLLAREVKKKWENSSVTISLKTLKIKLSIEKSRVKGARRWMKQSGQREGLGHHGKWPENNQGACRAHLSILG